MITRNQLTLTLYWIAIEARSHRGTRKVVRYCHVYHSHEHKVFTQFSRVRIILQK